MEVWYGFGHGRHFTGALNQAGIKKGAEIGAPVRFQYIIDQKITSKTISPPRHQGHQEHRNSFDITLKTYLKKSL
jgi:hypothetical protein